jgi:ABC-type antimicrobial peptide transport system permease subunit
MRPSGYNKVDYWSMYNDDGTMGDVPDPYFQPLNTKLKLVLGSSDDNAVDKKVSCDLIVKGVLNEDWSKGGETSWGAVMDAKQLQSLVNEYKRANNIVITDKGSYDDVNVKVSDISAVSDVEKEIKALGFSTYSMESVREPIEKETTQKQLMFAGLGVVSLFVAALGIMNTMIMSITERTREIGVMKALGCFIGNIRTMFLMEAGFIGLIGGVIGSLLSLVISCIINLVALKAQLTDGFEWSAVKDLLLYSTERTSVIPWQLALGAIAFSVFVGVISGYYPANKAATKISALEAIRTE